MTCEVCHSRYTPFYFRIPCHAFSIYWCKKRMTWEITPEHTDDDDLPWWDYTPSVKHPIPFTVWQTARPSKSRAYSVNETGKRNEMKREAMVILRFITWHLSLSIKQVARHPSFRVWSIYVKRQSRWSPKKRVQILFAGSAPLIYAQKIWEWDIYVYMLHSKSEGQNWICTHVDLSVQKWSNKKRPLTLWMTSTALPVPEAMHSNDQTKWFTPQFWHAIICYISI